MFCNERGRYLNRETASQVFARIVTRTTLPESGSTTCDTPTHPY